MKPDTTENLFNNWKSCNERWAKFAEDLNNYWARYAFWSNISMYIIGFCTCLLFWK